MWHFADLDWSTWLDDLAAWRPLSIFARRVVLDQLQPDLPIVTARLSGHLDALKAHGWIPPPAGRLPRRVPRARRASLALLRAMDRARLFETADHAAMVAYLKAHATPEAIAHALGRPGADPGVLAHVIQDDDGLPAFLQTSDPVAWARERWPQADLSRSMADAGDDARRLVEWLCEHRRPLALVERELHNLPLDDGALARALATTLPACLCFVALRGTDLEPVVGCWPPAAARVRRRRARTTPQTVEPVAQGADTEGAHAGLIDLTSLMTACAAEPPRLKAGGFALFKRARTDLAERLMPQPPWLASLLGFPPEDRVDDLLVLLVRLGYLHAVGGGGKNRHLQPTDAGQSWLRANDQARLTALLDVMRAIRRAVAGRDHEHPRHPFNGQLRFAPPSVDHLYADEQTRTEALVRGFGSLDVGRFLELEAFVDHQSTMDNPLASATPSYENTTGIGGWRKKPLDDESLERLWAFQLRRFLVDRLLLLGGVRLGRTAEGRTAFALTEAGHYLLGTADTFTLDHAGDNARLIVQPSFEVVFLAPSPLAEGRLAPLAERVGDGGVGVLFRLTRTAAQHAAAAGITADEAIERLRDAADAPVPTNVERQVREWIDRCRPVEVADAIVIRCPDAETATRVLATGGGRLQRLSDTVVELVDPSQRSTLLRRLRDDGLFPSSR